MIASSILQTPSSLLERLRQGNDPQAWRQFVLLYTPLLYRYARSRGLETNAADEVVQDVFVQLVTELPKFHYDRAKGRFRGWLWTVFATQYWLKVRKWDPLRDADRTCLLDIPDDSSAFGLSDAEYHAYLQRRIVETAQREFAPQTWAAFRLHVLEHREADDVARELGISVDSVYQAKRRVLLKLKQELEGLDLDH